MKIVCCKNCGAKYQLDDDDDISSFECSSCAGDLELLENYSIDQPSSNKGLLDSIKNDDSIIVQCQDCGLKFKLKPSDNILDYECDSCGGSLRYLDEESNKELDRYIEERRMEFGENSPLENSEAYENTRSIKSITNKLENFFSEDEIQKIAEEELEQERLRKGLSPRTAKTTIPQPVMSKFGSEFALPKSNDYNVLKNFLKDEFFKSVSAYYIVPEKEPSQGRFGGLKDRFTIDEPGDIIVSTNLLSDEEDFSISNINNNQIIQIVGAIIFILSIVELVLVHTGVGIATLIVGIAIIAFGLYRNRNIQETTKRTRIIREHLLTLPEDYYVFYNVKTPTSPVGINHLVVGPTGIYALLSKKYEPKNNNLLNDKDNVEFIKSIDNDDDKFMIDYSGSKKRFRYTTKQAKFSKDDAIKQKALSLGEDLINFLNENNIKNCFVEPLVGFINDEVVVINMPLTDEDLFIDELLNTIRNSTIKLDSETIDKCAVLISRYSADCSLEI